MVDETSRSMLPSELSFHNSETKFQKPALACVQEYVGIFQDRYIHLSNQLIVVRTGFEPVINNRYQHSMLRLPIPPPDLAFDLLKSDVLLGKTLL